MKKNILLLILLSIFILFSCNNEEEQLNVEENKQVYDDFLEDYKKYENKIKKADSYIFTSNVKYKIKNSKTDEVLIKKAKYSNLKVSLNPFYIEANEKEDGVLSTTVLNEKDGYIYSNDITSKNSLYSSRLIPIAQMNYETLPFILNRTNSNFYFDYEYDVNSGNAKKSTNKYTFKQEYTNIRNKNIEYLNLLFYFMKIETNNTLKINVTTDVYFLNKILHFKHDIKLLYFINNIYYNYEIEFVETYRKAKVNTTPTFEQMIKLSLPTSIDEVISFSELNDVYDYDFKQVYHKYYLKKGYYKFKTLDYSSLNFKYTIYDRNKNKVENTKIVDINIEENNEFDKIFKIEKSGVYYIEIRSQASNIKMALIKTNYDDCFIEKNVELDKTIHIESREKFHILKFYLDEEVDIQLQTTAKHLNVICLDDLAYEKKHAYDNLNLVFKGQKGENVIIICEEFLNCDILLSKLVDTV